jgi:hypothetical protein
MEIGSTAVGHTDENFERRRRKAEAKLNLAFLSRYDSVVDGYERLGGRTDLSAAEVDRWRDRRRRDYRAATGVEIEQRECLKARLQEIVRTGERSVSEVIEELRLDYVNGMSSSGGSSEPGFEDAA